MTKRFIAQWTHLLFSYHGHIRVLSDNIKYVKNLNMRFSQCVLFGRRPLDYKQINNWRRGLCILLCSTLKWLYTIYACNSCQRLTVVQQDHQYICKIKCKIMIYKCPNLKFPLAIIKPAEYLLHGEQWSKLLADFSCGLYCSIPAALQSLLKQTKNTATRARRFSVRMTLKLKSIFHSGLALADSQIRARQYFAHKVYIYWILQYSTRFRKLTVTLFQSSCLVVVNVLYIINKPLTLQQAH